jgi:LacI family transcriptional regulator
MATIRTVADHAGVSTATVSRVMNTPDKVREPTRLRVEAAMRELNFSRNEFAASLVTQQSNCIGLIVADLSGGFFAPLISQVEQVVSQSGSFLVISCSKNTESEVQGALAFLRQRRCDAIILFSAQLSDAALQQALRENPTLVAIHRTVPGFETRCLQIDNRTGARLAARYLIDCGHREFGLITGPLSNPESNERRDGFLATLAAAQIEVPPQRIVLGDFQIDSGRHGMADLLATNQPISAVFCLNDQMALGALDYCRAVGVAVPGQISLMGFDDVEIARLVHPRLSTIACPMTELARSAAQLALDLAAGQRAQAIRALFAPTLMIRDSVRQLG